MARFEFEEIDSHRVPGLTLRSKKHPGFPETGIYIPPAHQPNATALNVVLWLHGFFVQNIQNLFSPAKNREAKIRQSVLASREDVVLIAPHMGWVHDDYSNKENFGAGVLGRGKGGEDYLVNVLDGLTEYMKTCYESEGPAKKLDIVNLYVACHSGGGYGGMVPIVETLGRFKAPVLKECWGFDCMYGGGTYWEPFYRGHNDINLYFYSGGGSAGRNKKGPGTRKEIFQCLQADYGPPGKTRPSSMNNVYTALTFAGVENDRIAFQSADSIQKQQVPATVYEQKRKLLDPLLGDQQKFWKAFDDANSYPLLKGHFEIPADLLTPRIKKSMSKPGKS